METKKFFAGLLFFVLVLLIACERNEIQELSSKTAISKARLSTLASSLPMSEWPDTPVPTPAMAML